MNHVHWHGAAPYSQEILKRYLPLLKGFPTNKGVKLCSDNLTFWFIIDISGYFQKLLKIHSNSDSKYKMTCQWSRVNCYIWLHCKNLGICLKYKISFDPWLVLKTVNIKVHIQHFTRKKGFIENVFCISLFWNTFIFLHIQKTYFTL